MPEQKKSESRLQAQNDGEPRPTGRSQQCTHNDHLALGNTDPPQQQADTSTIRPREAVGPPLEVVARPTLTPQDQTLNCTSTENELQSSSNSLRIGSKAGKQRLENVGAVVVVRLLAIYVRGICATVAPSQPA